MKICLIGDSLSNLVLAKNLLGKKIKIDLFYEPPKNRNNTSRTIGITQDNMNYIKNNIFNKKTSKNDIKYIKIPHLYRPWAGLFINNFSK